jgi:hypothetical protein
MRFSLEGLEGKRLMFIATFWHYGTFQTYRGAGRTILLKCIRDVKGRLLADHVWINYTPSFDLAGELRQGDIVTFDARVGKYIKGYFGERIEDRLAHPACEDYRLNYPHNVKKIGTRDMNISILPPSSGPGCFAGAGRRLQNVPQ